MDRTHLALSWGNRVASEAGWSAKLRGVYMAPRSGRITHMLVQRGFRRHTGLLMLDNARQEADGMLVLPEQRRQGAAAPGRGSVPFTAKTVVHCSDGTSVSLRGLILNRQRHSVEYVLAGNKGNARAITYQQVQKLASGSPSITLGQTDLEALPVFAPDNEAQRNALAALESADLTGRTFRAVRVQVVDGTAHLAGNVGLPVQCANAERAIGQAKGILNVQSTVVTDWDLQIGIAEALAKKGLMQQGLVMVKSSLGRITLSGHLSTPELVDTAIAVAAGVPGVQSVEHSIKVQPLPAAEPAPTPATDVQQSSDGTGEAEAESPG